MITAYGRNDAVPNDHPHYLGPLGPPALQKPQACRRADVLLVVGSRLGHFTTFYDQRYIQPGTRIVQIDIDSRDIGRTYPGRGGDPGRRQRELSALLHALESTPSGRRPAWQEEMQGWRRQTPAAPRAKPP